MVNWSEHIKCPNCFSHSFADIKDGLACVSCGKKIGFKYSGSIIDLLPDNHPPLVKVSSEVVKDYYSEQYGMDFHDNNDVRGWGGEGKHQGYNFFINKEREELEKSILNLKNRDLLIDLSGGNGFYSFYFARYFKKVIHCDISIRALNHAYRESLEKKIHNISFARCDYRNLPFQDNVANAVIIMDSLEYYGVDDDRNVLADAIGVLKPNALLLFDLHIKRSFKVNRSIFEYSLKDRRKLLRLNHNFLKVEVVRLGRLPMRLLSKRVFWKISSLLFFIPPMRNLYFLSKGND